MVLFEREPTLQNRPSWKTNNIIAGAKGPYEEHTCSRTCAGVKVPCLAITACLRNAFTLAAVGVPEVLLFADVGAGLDFADLALAAFGIELLVGPGAVFGNQRAVAHASCWVPNVVRWASLGHEFAIA